MKHTGRGILYSYMWIVALLLPPLLCLYGITRSSSDTTTLLSSSSFARFATWIPIAIASAIGSSLLYVSLFGHTSQMVDQRKRNERSKALFNKFSWVLKFSVVGIFAAGALLTGYALMLILLIPVVGILGFVVHLDRSRRSMWRRSKSSSR